ncbi:enolase C-terminal domain-like protein [Streptomyces sp. bgisy154]|uniref:enolase C-terminal domain-like protein n=1 Tax=Streptomyces sp. bgisy154 TaxID=3413794 RepID=UPI003D756740
MSPIPARVTALDTYDIRFPTSRELDGSDAMNPDPDYSAAYAVLRTDAADGHQGHGFTFTIGRGNDVQVAAIEALREHVVGREVDRLCADPGTLSRDLVGDSQLRWLGPEKGVMHMAIGAVVNAAWDLAAKRAGKPLWRLLAEAEPEWLVRQIDFRYLTDALTPDDALRLLWRGKEGSAERTARLLERGYPAYTTSAGWLGYDDAELTRLAAQAGALDVLQLDAARVGGVNENLAILLLAARFGVPVCPHAGGVGLCELVQHLSMFDYVALSGTTEDRVIEYVDHLHDHFLEPVVIRDGHYTAPTAPGFSAAMLPGAVARYTYPDGAFWAADLATGRQEQAA